MTDPVAPVDDRADVLPTAGSTPWDLLVIGGGTAGIVAAKTAAGFGASVLLVERDRTGGECLWTGCVPSKALLAAAAVAADARRAAEFGVQVDGVRVDFAAVMGHVKAAIAAIEPHDSTETLTAAGVRVSRGTARFTQPDRVDIDGRPVRFRQAVIATGSEPLLPPVTGLADADPLTSDSVWELPALPARLVVLGGASIGCELGQAFARLGSQVSVIEAAPRLLPREDPDVAAAISASLGRDGVAVITGATVTAVHRTSGADGTGEVHLAGGQRIGFDRLLIAVGRRPRSYDLGLDAAGVEVDERSYVRVDRMLRSTNRRIWAAGDVTGHPQFTHTAGVHASLAASNAVLGLRRRVELTALPRGIYTQPEAAAVGLSLADADRHGLTVRTVSHQDVDRAVTDGRTGGFTRLVLDGKGRVLGATVVGPRAGETLAELVLAVRRGLRARDLAGTIPAYPTYGSGAWDAAIADVRARLHAPGAGRAIVTLAAVRRRWMVLRDRLG
ncbi:MAG TPA: FAD-dependent oxidoreductase [Jatrophihabitantaceae bacterium]|nr:FAD-dependent oxidoreductase [Jatrophihabitantaceae bacterium]